MTCDLGCGHQEGAVWHVDRIKEHVEKCYSELNLKLIDIKRNDQNSQLYITFICPKGHRSDDVQYGNFIQKYNTTGNVCRKCNKHKIRKVKPITVKQVIEYFKSVPSNIQDEFANIISEDSINDLTIRFIQKKKQMRDMFEEEKQQQIRKNEEEKQQLIRKNEEEKRVLNEQIEKYAQQHYETSKIMSKQNDSLIECIIGMQ